MNINKKMLYFNNIEKCHFIDIVSVASVWIFIGKNSIKICTHEYINYLFRPQCCLPLSGLPLHKVVWISQVTPSSPNMLVGKHILLLRGRHEDGKKGNRLKFEVSYSVCACVCDYNV